MRGGAHPPLPFEAQMGPNDRGMFEKLSPACDLWNSYSRVCHLRGQTI